MGRIGLVGESLGGTTVLLAAAAEPRIRAVWSDSAYARADTIVSDRELRGKLLVSHCVHHDVPDDLLRPRTALLIYALCTVWQWFYFLIYRHSQHI